MMKYQVTKREAVSQRALELSRTQTNKQKDSGFTSAYPLAFVTAQPINLDV